MRVLNADQMREADRRTIEDLGVPSAVLMENAGRQVVAAMDAAFDRLADARVAVLAGRGNNGGDGFVIARVLSQAGVDVQAYLLGSAAEVRGDARVNLDILGRLGLDVVEIRSAQDWELHGAAVLQRDIVVDALFGTGLKTPLEGLAETMAQDLNASPVPVVAVDLPSGLSADDPSPIGPLVEASMTVTFGAPKLPLVLPPGEPFAGSLVVAEIGIPASVIDELPGPRIEHLQPTGRRGRGIGLAEPGEQLTQRRLLLVQQRVDGGGRCTGVAPVEQLRPPGPDGAERAERVVEGVRVAEDGEHPAIVAGRARP